MSVTSLQKKTKILELFRKQKSADVKHEMSNLASERVHLADTLDEIDAVTVTLKEIDAQLISQTYNELSAFNFEQKLNYSKKLQLKNDCLQASLESTEENIVKIESLLKNILKQEEKINEKIDDVKKELSQLVDKKIMKDNA